VKTLPLLEEHPRSVQILLVVVAPAVFGAVTGYFLGVSEPVYLVLSLIGIVGGVGAGYDHFGAKSGAARGVIAGSVFGASILIAHELHGASAKAHLPEPAILLVALTTVLAVAFAALGGWLRERSMRDSRTAAAPAPADMSAAPAGSVAATPPTAAPLAAASPATAPTASPSAAQATGTVPATGGSISLNSGTFEDYRGLGMSITQAKRVIVYRERLDGYSSVEQLDSVPGFSKEFLVHLKRQLQV
jgi:DNA uptake protein ComE-like DNA-binding protein